MSATDRATDRYSRVFGAYDIRGIVGADIDSALVRAIARAYGEYVCPDRQGHFLIGRDGRWSSAAFAEAASFGLRECGHRITHIGVASTPMIYWYGAEAGFDGSIAISASHLHPNYNGMKLCRSDAMPLSSEEGLPEIADMLRRPRAACERQSSELVRHVSVLADYASEIRRHLKPSRPVRLAVDAGNGMGGLATESVLGPSDSIDLWPLNFRPDPRFPVRPSNPLEPGALDELAATVKKRGLEFGVAFDGDADRAVAVDERGVLVPPDVLGGLIALHVLKASPGAAIVHDVRVSRAIPELIKEAGGRPVPSRVGHAFIKRLMRETQALFAMELSGHYYYSDLHYTDNGERTLVELANLVSFSEQTLSLLAKPLQRYPTSGEINLEVQDRAGLLVNLEQMYKDGNLGHLDGLSVDYPDWWFNARLSNTEPVVRINIGAVNNDLLGKKRDELMQRIERIAA